jgi:hypothetical protein
MPTMQEIEIAQKIYEAEYPGDIYYVAAMTQVEIAISLDNRKGITVGIAILLLDWNKEYYFRWHKSLLKGFYFSEEHLSHVEDAISQYLQSLRDLRRRSILSFSSADEIVVKKVFREFQSVLGPVGAAKSLHLIAPLFFPLWDNSIAKEGYGIDFGSADTERKADLYCRFMNKVKEQCQQLGGEQSFANNLLKAIDQFNFIKYTKKLI